jgi:hypothetical protein
MVYSGAEGTMMFASVVLAVDAVEAVDASAPLRYFERDSPGRTIASEMLADSGDSL